MFAGRPGLGALLKEGGKHFSGLEESTYRNIEACVKLSALTKSSFGPNCMNKLIVNHIDKQFVTSDAATIIEQLEVQHPAAKLIALASKMQEQMYGDGSNLVVVIAGELLRQAETLLKQGLHSIDVIRGYELALPKAVSLLETQCGSFKVNDIRSSTELQAAIACIVSSKLLGNESLLARLVADAAVFVMPSKPADFNPENIRVCKLTGGSLAQSHMLSGVVVGHDCHGTTKAKNNCKVMVLGCGLEMISTEAKGTILINSADQLLNFSRNEEERIGAVIKNVADAGVDAIIVGGAVSDVAQHFCDRYDILVLKCQSKFEMRRICQVLGATSLVKLGVPTPDEIGHADYIGAEEISSKKVTVIRARDSRVATIVLRSATGNYLDECERTIGNASRAIQNIARDNRFVAGGGAAEVEIGLAIQSYGRTLTGLEQYGVIKFGESLDIVSKTIAQNCGYNATQVLTTLYASHKQRNPHVGVDAFDTTGSSNGTIDVLKHSQPMADHFLTKLNALQLATDAVLTVLRIDQIIMARPAGGPKPPEQSGNWDED